jgi:hypothetical protein
VNDGPPPFTFVVGCGRSGTTVLRTVLDAHPHLAVAHEGRFVSPLGKRRSRYERPEGFDTDRLVADLLADRATRTNLELDEDDLRAALVPPVADFADATRRVFAHYAAKRGKDRYGDKFPGYVLRMDLLAGLFPEGRFVHIVRDGRDVALSNRAIEGQWDDAVALALNWAARVRAGREAGARLGPGRYHEVRYEALVATPGETVAPVCRFLDLTYEPAMLAFAARDGAVPAKVEANPATPGWPSRSRPGPGRGAATWNATTWPRSRLPRATSSTSSATSGLCPVPGPRPRPGHVGPGPLAGPPRLGPALAQAVQRGELVAHPAGAKADARSRPAAPRRARRPASATSRETAAAAAFG